MSQTISKLNIYELDKRLGAGLGADGDEGLRDFINRMRLLTGDNPLAFINDCQTVGDWTESDSGTFDVAANTTDEKIGTTCMKFTATAACDGTQNIETTVIQGSALAPVAPDGLDWREYDFFGGWQFGGGAGDFGTLGEMAFNIKNDGSWGTAVNVPVPTNAVHQYFDVDITSLARNKVQAIRFECNNTNAGEAVSYDDLKIYKFSTGRGPMDGPCKPVYPVSAAALTRGDIVSYSSGIIHRVEEESGADQVDDFGVTVIGATGDDGHPPAEAWVQYAGHLLLRVNAATVAGEGLIWQSEHASQGHLVQGEATGVDEAAFAKGLEAAGAQYDDILCELARTATFIS
tara:strand:+ start:1546 stop:2583 length:1038 start_codon:yes stop_codon:yes gene_type:complete